MVAISYALQAPPVDPTKHHTPSALAQRLLDLVPFKLTDHLHDPAAGSNKVFYNFFPGKRSYCEITSGIDYLTVPLKYDWAITNPPYHLLWLYIDKASREATQGFAYLVNINGVNTLTPRRLQLLRERGFHLRRVHICSVKGWFGRYYWYIFIKQSGHCQHSWDKETW